MKIQFNIIKKSAFAIVSALLLFGCQNLDRPALGDYAKDEGVVGGPLKFYVNFDVVSSNPLLVAVDNVRAAFPTDNPLTTIDGVSGKAIQGATGKFINYAKPNDFGSTAQSFTISFWEKRNGQTQNNTLTNGPEYPFSLTTSNGHWSGSTLMLMFEGNNTASAVKFVLVDKNMNDNWLTWEGSESVAGLLDNTWHHCAFVYDAATSGLTFYKDGAKISTKTWAGHGNLNLDDSKITALRIGAGPGTNYTTDDWLSSTWKGGLDQFRMYGTALTAIEINALYTGKK